MKLALVLGKKQGESVKNRLEGIKDNLNMDIFTDVPNYIDLSYKKNIKYDRVLVISTLLNDKVLSDLHNYWTETSKDTQIVVMGKKGKDEDSATKYLQMFQSPVVAYMLVESTTVNLVAEAVLLQPHELNDKYGIKDFMHVKLDDDEVVVPQGLIQAEIPKEETPVQQVQPQQAQPQQNQGQQKAQKQPKEKKGGLLGGLFGKKQKQQTQQPQQQVETINQEISQTQQTVQSNIQDSAQFNNSQDYVPQQYDAPLDAQQMQQVYTPDEQIYSDETQLNNNFQQNTEVNNQNTTLPDDNFGEANFDEFNQQSESDTMSTTNEIEDDFDFGSNAEQIQESNQNEMSTMQQPQQFVAQEESFDYSGKNDFGNDAQPIEVDEDFGFDTIEQTQEDVWNTPRLTQQVTEVDDDLSDMNVASAEAQYRQQNEQPKVVVKEVVKEVVRDTGRGTINALKGVYSGKTHKVIVVTGDRGTGITLTALNLAKEFSKKVNVLYFDCDVVNHGLLSYIDYDNFRDYENIHMQGVKLAKNHKAFNNCVCKYDNNLDILTTDYSCEVTDEEIEDASATIAEVVGDYGVTIVDCPVSKLHLVADLVMIGNTILCVEGSKRGFMNMLSQLENSALPMRYKRSIVSKGTMFITKIAKNTDMKKLKSFIGDIFVSTGADWMAMQSVNFTGKLNDNLLNNILE